MPPSHESRGAGRPPTSRDVGQEEDVVSGASDTRGDPPVALAFYLGAYFGIKVAIEELEDKRKTEAVAGRCEEQSYSSLLSGDSSPSCCSDGSFSLTAQPVFFFSCRTCPSRDCPRQRGFVWHRFQIFSIRNLADKSITARAVLGGDCSAGGEAAGKTIRLSTSRISPSVEYPNKSFWASTLPEE